MEIRIKERFNDDILRQVMQRYDIAPGDITLLDGFESFMYAFTRQDDDFVLRIGHSFRRSQAMIQGEVDWLHYLAAGGAAVAGPVLSPEGRLVEVVDDGRGAQFLATAFHKAPGRSPRAADWTPEMMATYGQLLGRMHALSQRYEPPDSGGWRPHWDDEMMSEVARLLPPTEEAALARYEALMRHLRALPRDEVSYGLVHQDAHGGNFFITDSGQITLFDFDDCVYSWYANDIAIVLFYAGTGVPDPAAFTAHFMPHFLRGYRRENRLHPDWLAQFPHFLKLRELELYAVIHRSYDVDNITNAWVAAFMRGRKQRIVDNIPYILFDFTSLAAYL